MNPVREAIFDRLVGDATLTALLSSPTAVHHQVAPQTEATPFVVFNKQAGTPMWAFGGPALQNDLWQVKAIALGSSASDAEVIAARIDVALTNAVLVITGSTHLYLRRESDVDYPEQDGADTYRHCGALYRLISEPS